MILDCAIIGGGPAGLTAGLYTTRGGLQNVTMFEKGMPGGQITLSSEIENYPGVTGDITGMDLMDPWPEQCKKFGLVHDMSEVVNVSKVDNIFHVTKEGSEVVEAHSVIVATGSVPRRAGFKGEDEFFGRGVSTCATCDGFFYKGKEVAVLGGGDTALEEALHLTKLCSRVYIIHRNGSFRASPNTIARVEKAENVEIIYNATVDEVYGDNMGVTGVKINLENDEKRDLSVPGIFVFVGRNVNNGVLKQENGTFLCELADGGQVQVDINMNTSCDGLYAVGDLRIDAAKQVVCAAADGAVAALQAMKYVDEKLHS